MAAIRFARALELVENLERAGIPATHDPARIPAILSRAGRVVLAPPPRLEFTVHHGSVTYWRLVVLAAAGLAVSDAWARIDELVEDVADVLDAEGAEPTSYDLGNGAEPVPAYVVTFSEIVST